MDRQFKYGDVEATLISPTDETLMDTARYIVRLQMYLKYKSANSSPEGVPQFAHVLAQVRNPVNFPFEIPDPLSHPLDIVAVWDVFLDSDPGLWDALIPAIQLPYGADQGYWLQAAMDEFEDQIVRGQLPPPRWPIR